MLNRAKHLSVNVWRRIEKIFFLFCDDLHIFDWNMQRRNEPRDLKKIRFTLLYFILLKTGLSATYPVTSNADAGANTLRTAITIANSNAGADIITFSLTPAGTNTITLLSALPTLTDNSGVTIDGFSQPGSGANTNMIQSTTPGLNGVLGVVLYNGANIPVGLSVTSNNNIIKGLCLPNFGDASTSENDIAIDIRGNNNQVTGCYIGTDVTGSTGFGTSYFGIQVTGSANIIGNGTAAGVNLVAGMANIVDQIASNPSPTTSRTCGVFLTGAGASNNQIRGNYIGGLRADGINVLASFSLTPINGISLCNAGSGNIIGGGAAAGFGNVISALYDKRIQWLAGGNTSGIYIYMGSGSNTIAGNYIGQVRADGINRPGGYTIPVIRDYFSYWGVLLYFSDNNTIGGSTAAERNVIKNNNGAGVAPVECDHTVIKGNYLGVGADGITGSTGQLYGVFLSPSWTGSSSTNTTIGGSNPGEGNVISGQMENIGGIGIGIEQNLLTPLNVVIIGNIIGLGADGISSIDYNNPNGTCSAQGNGIEILHSYSITIGGTTLAERNIISDNWGPSGVVGSPGGINIVAAFGFGGSTGVKILGNRIGSDINGNLPSSLLPQSSGITIQSQAGGVTVGDGTAAGANVISGNNVVGIVLAGNSNTIMGNIIGPDTSGTRNITDHQQANGIIFGGTTSVGNIIGGSQPGQGNVISANTTNGIFFNNGGVNNSIIGNIIGLKPNGTDTIGGSSQDNGIRFSGPNTYSNTIGGINPGEGNVISGNTVTGAGTGTGILMQGTNAGGNTIVGNIIGLQKDKQSLVQNNIQNTGIDINGSRFNTIGGTTAGARNIISGNNTAGIQLRGAANNNNKIYGNYIGSTYSLTPVAGSSQDYGVYITATTASTNFMGGYSTGQANTIAYNTVNGIGFTAVASNNNLISRNTIYDDVNFSMSKAINLSGVANANYAIPTLSSVSATQVSGTALNNTDSVEVFKTDANCINAKKYLGTTVVSAGAWTLTGLSLTAGDKVFANVRNKTNYNTSEFCVCICANATINVTANTTMCEGSGQFLSVIGSSNYQWTPNYALTASTGDIIIANPTVTTTYTVTETACGTIATVNLFVIPKPPLTVTSANASVCLGSCTTVSASGANTYLWSPALFLSAATGQIVTACPTVSASYTITGADNSGYQCSNTVYKTIGVNTSLAITAGPDQSICPMTSTTLTATGGSTYSWSPNTNLNSVTGSSVICTPTALSTTTYSINAVDANGCAGSAMITVTQVTAITANAGADKSICTGTCTTLTGSGGSTYVWQSSGALTNPSTFNPTACPTATATAYTLTAYGGAMNCFSIDVVVISLLSLPTISTSGDATVCRGNAATLFVSGANSYLWIPNTALNAATGSSVSASPSVNITYTVSGADANGCIASANVNVTVSVNPLPAISVNPSAIAICSGASQALAAGGSSVAPPIDYTWSAGASPNTGSNVTITAVILSGVEEYTVTGTDQNNCYNTAVASITVNPNPVITISPEPAVVCNGSSLSITASGASTYFWTSADNSLTPTTGTIVSADPTATVSYIITGTDGNNCSASHSFTVTVTPALLVTASADITICPAASAVLTAFGAGATSYNWSPVTSPASGDNVATFPKQTATAYTVTGTANNCTGTDVVVVDIYPTTPVSLGPDISINKGSSTTLAVSTAGTITWTPTEGLSCNDCPDPEANPIETTSYTITVTDANGCSSSDNITVYVIINCGDLPFVPNAFSPNGDHENDILYAFMDPSCAHLFLFQVFDRWGNRVFESDTPEKGWNGNYKNGKDADPGVYVYKISNAQGLEIITKAGNVSLVR